MTMLEIYNMVNSAPEYAFLHENEHLGSNIMLLTLGGSYAYGTNIETSDVDIRGCALNTGVELLTGNDFEVVTNEATDTTIYSFKKLVSLLYNCNPNTIEMLGCRPEHYMRVSEAGRLLLDNAGLFLSQKAVNSFSGYANAQLRRLENFSNVRQGEEQLEKYILGTMKHVSSSFSEKYGIPEDVLNLYIDKAVNEDMSTEIFMDITLHHYPLRDYCELWAELKNIVKSYKSVGCRNNKAMEHKKLNKHMMHLIRLYLMGIDILEGKGIVTYREVEHDLLMDIRDGKFLTDDLTPTPEFYEMVDDMEKRFEYAKDNTVLPKKPDWDKVMELVVEVNKCAFSEIML